MTRALQLNICRFFVTSAFICNIILQENDKIKEKS